jgi:uracil-DNA glycosylase
MTGGQALRFVLGVSLGGLPGCANSAESLRFPGIACATPAHSAGRMSQCWADLQTAVAACTRCESEVTDVDVECPPGLLYPTGTTPPNRVRVLFVGVAPPATGHHFYTDPSDNLRRGLFAVLRELGRPCHDIQSFIARGFFLVHTAKCSIRGTTAPDVRVSRFCSSIHLRKEIACVAPDGLCFLSKNIGFPVYKELAREWGTAGDIAFGMLTTLLLDGKPIDVIATAWPGRGHEAVTRTHLHALFCRLGLAT